MTQNQQHAARRQTPESHSELRLERLRADVIVRNLGEGVLVTDAQGKVVSMSRAAEAVLGWKLEELAGKPFVEVVPMLDEAGKPVPAADRPLLQALRHGRNGTTTVIYRRKNGRTVPVSVTSAPMVVDGKTLGIASTFHDLSEERGVLRAKSEFTTLASHQLRTPLSVIAWTSELLLNGDAGKLTPEQHKYVSDIYASNRRMAALVSEMLMVSSLELGALPVKPQPFDIVALAVDVMREQTQKYNDKKLRVTQQYASSLPKLSYDPDLVRVLLRTLLSNAFKYTPAGGRVTLDIGVLQPAERQWLPVVVQDTGYGIPAADTGNIFGKFFRAANVMSKDPDGTGLGLYIVKRLLDYVGGRISFASQEGVGTTFTMLLPLAGMAPHRPRHHADMSWEGIDNV